MFFNGDNVAKLVVNNALCEEIVKIAVINC